jgi:predicted esterase
MDSAEQLIKLATEEANMSYQRNIKKVFLGGNAEGCMVVLAAFMRYEGKMQIGGILGLNGFQALDMNKEMRRSSLEAISTRMITQRKVPMMLIHGENNEKIKYKDARETYVYFQNLYASKPNNYMFFKEKEGTDTLSDEYLNHVRKWFVK